MAAATYLPLPQFGDSQGYGKMTAPAAFISIEGRPDPSPAVFEVLSPAPGQPLQALGEVRIRVTDPEGLSPTTPLRAYAVTPDATEVMFEGYSFRYPYSGVRTQVENGFELRIFRRGGWKQLEGGYRFEATALNAQGVET